MKYGFMGNVNPDLGPAQPSNGSNGSFFNRVLQPVMVKAGSDAKAAAEQATVDAIKKLAQKPGAKIPDVTVAPPAAPVGLMDKFNALPAWQKYLSYAAAGIVVLKLVSPGRD